MRSLRILTADDNYYRLTLRAKLPNTPFTTVYFPAMQYCRTADGGELSNAWVGTTPHDDAAHAGTPTEEPAPSVFVLPARSPGWNKYTVTEHVHDLTVFKDAQIVWAGTAAYGANPDTAALIAAEPGVTVLSEIHPGTEIWVKY